MVLIQYERQKGRTSNALSLFLKDAALLQITLVFGKAFLALTALLQAFYVSGVFRFVTHILSCDI